MNVLAFEHQTWGSPAGEVKTYGRLSLDLLGAWVIEDVAPHVSLRLKQIFPRIAKTAVAPFKLSDSDAVCADLLWFTSRYPLDMDGRLRRPGQTRQVDAIYLHSNFGSDPLMIETLGVKASQARNIVDPLAGAEIVFSDESRIQALAKQYLEKRGVA